MALRAPKKADRHSSAFIGFSIGLHRLWPSFGGLVRLREVGKVSRPDGPYLARAVHVTHCFEMLRFVAFCHGPARRSAPARKRKGQQRSAKVSLSGDGRFDPSQCPRAAAPVIGAGRMFHICSHLSGFKGPRRRPVAFASPCRRGASVSSRHRTTACRRTRSEAGMKDEQF